MVTDRRRDGRGWADDDDLLEPQEIFASIDVPRLHVLAPSLRFPKPKTFTELARRLCRRRTRARSAPRPRASRGSIG